MITWAKGFVNCIAENHLYKWKTAIRSQRYALALGVTPPPPPGGGGGGPSRWVGGGGGGLRGQF